jgi:DNA-binding transcriptional MerR regulator
VVRGALALGFTLEELTRVLRVRDRGGAPCRQVHALALYKLSMLDRKIAELDELRTHLRTIVEHWKTRLEGTPDGQRARLLETLIHSPARKED